VAPAVANSVSGMTPTLARRAGALTIIAVTTIALAGCGGVGAKLTFNDTEKVKITEVDMTGGSGDITVKTSAINETRITRIVHRNADPGKSYRVDGTVLHVNTDCGMNCSVSYEIEAPTGVAVVGKLSSGNVGLTDVASADVTVTSGNVAVNGATGAVKAQATSGDISVLGTKGPVSLRATSGDVRAVNLSGGPIEVVATSGDVDLNVAVPTSVNASASSGNVHLMIPGGSYRVDAAAGSGDTHIAGITDDQTAKNVLNLRAGSGDVDVTATA
jgi:hypothetical protein